jgi:2-isopropylmalate synthase
MKQIRISDATMKQVSESFSLSFKEKIELSKLLDKLGVDVIELEGIDNVRIDSLRIKSIAVAVCDSAVAVPVEMNDESIEQTWNALKMAKKPRLQVSAPTSAVQIEYLFHKKPDAMINDIATAVAKCASFCNDVEFIANDATRSEQSYLTLAIKTAIEAGATTVTLADTAGNMFPNELAEFIALQYEMLPELKSVKLGICTSNALSMAEACAISAITAGAEQIRAAAYPLEFASLTNIARILAAKSDTLDVSCSVHASQLTRITEQVGRMCESDKKPVFFGTSEDGETDISLTSHDDLNAISLAVTKLGYDLSEDDTAKVYNAFKQIAEKKERMSLKELDAIVASSAMQVPETYKLDTYVITSGNTISATAHIKLTKNGQAVEGVYIGDGSIDAAFQAIEKIVGRHYELDDFQLQAVTEGREAMGQTVVKLRSGAKVYSGRGISTDIVGAGIQAYLSALNKIIYEEEVE